MQIKKTAIAVTILALAPQAFALQAWAAPAKQAAVIIQNFPEDVLTDSVGIYLTPRGQQIFNKGAKLLGENGIQINNGFIPEWDYAATSTIDIQDLPINMSGQKETLEDFQKVLKTSLPNFQPFNNPKINVKVKGISYEVQIKNLSLAPDLEETQFLHTPNTIVVNAQIEATQLKLGVSSLVVTDTNNKLFGNGDIGLNNLSINSPSESLTFTIPMALSLDSQGHITISALRVDDNLSNYITTWDYSKLNLPALQFSLTDSNDKHAAKDGLKSSFNWAPLESQLRTKLPEIAKVVATYLSGYVKTNGVSKINQAISGTFDANSVFQEVNTMSPPGAPTGTTPVPYIWGMQPHTLSLTNGFLFTQINTFIEDPLSAQHIALPDADRSEGLSDMSAVDPATYDMAMQLDEGFVNRLLQLSFLRGYFNSIAHAGGPPLKLVAAPTIKANGTDSPDHLKMHIVLDYTNLPQGFVAKIVDNLVIRNPLQITFDMNVILKSDPKAGTITLFEGPIDVDSAQVDPSGIKIKMATGKVMDSVHSSLTQFNNDLEKTPSALTSPIGVPLSIAGTSLVLKTAQADPKGNIMIYVEFGGTAQ